ncbi:Tm-1-like ATP-binding domain-containing protein [Streptomyces sp. NPDC059802]|uniref:Tm-1-like ATP-binding domain-containing protein n=1 Tax=Streptomyces sp. NPDC059802 TaxID=3346952 RepID=UPI003653CDF5
MPPIIARRRPIAVKWSLPPSDGSHMIGRTPLQRSRNMATVVLVGTLDTKGAEYAWLSARLRESGCDVVLVDAGVMPSPVGARAGGGLAGPGGLPPGRNRRRRRGAPRRARPGGTARRRGPRCGSDRHGRGCRTDRR